MKYSEYLNEEDFQEELASNGSLKWYCKASSYQSKEVS
jgi:hypothetical protein